eukprot:CAMPEP_0197037274 /NCGR_PEP_ID=MMETSP1384-20130603/14528_1 /TAXON_ID=29189 /ORGANISM="Ammonia sp." /LENGTH=432 /DNA_ID=CAMNT_0042467553 /DNA_START=5 /DNA_END=1303 /DNA_ORIENTATION=+
MAQKLTAEMAHLQQKNEHLQNIINDYTTKYKEIEMKLQHEFNKKEEEYLHEIAQLRQNVTDSKSVLRSFRMQSLSNHQSETQSILEQNSEYQAQIRLLKQEITKHKSTIDALKREKTDLASSNEHQKRELGAKDYQISLLKHQVDQQMKANDMHMASIQTRAPAPIKYAISATHPTAQTQGAHSKTNSRSSNMFMPSAKLFSIPNTPFQPDASLGALKQSESESQFDDEEPIPKSNTDTAMTSSPRISRMGSRARTTVTGTAGMSDPGTPTTNVDIQSMPIVTTKLKGNESNQSHETVRKHTSIDEPDAIHEYTTTKRQLVIKQDPYSTTTHFWLRVYVEMKQQWIMVYLRERCTVEKLLGLLRMSKELVGVLEDAEQVEVFCGDDDGELDEMAPLSKEQVLRTLGVMNICITSAAGRLSSKDPATCTCAIM